jgi:hypothetical protein
MMMITIPGYGVRDGQLAISAIVLLAFGRNPLANVTMVVEAGWIGYGHLGPWRSSKQDAGHPRKFMDHEHSD